MPPPDPPQDYPDDSIQGVVGSQWWKHTTSGQVARGRLLWAFVPIVGLTPRTLEVEGRTSPTDHGAARFKLTEMRVRQQATAPKLPVAALPNYPGEAYAVYRAKRRPVLLVSTGGDDLAPEVRKGLGWQGAAMLLVAPYFGADPGGTRGGWPEEFVRRIRRGEYPQYSYDRLPLSGSKESILRLDQLQPIGRHHDSYERTEFTLSDEALEILDSWLVWLTTGRLDTGSTLSYMRTEIPKTFKDEGS